MAVSCKWKAGNGIWSGTGDVDGGTEAPSWYTPPTVDEYSTNNIMLVSWTTPRVPPAIDTALGLLEGFPSIPYPPAPSLTSL